MAAIHEMNEKSLPGTCFVFKHSTRCPVSTAAAAEVRSIKWSIPLYWVNVVEQRDISNWVAQHTGVKHESPQLIELADGVVRKVWNHSEIRSGKISQ